MSKNINQVFIANPITTNVGTDLMYFGRSPYGATNDTAMTYTNFSAQFSPATGSTSITTLGTITTGTWNATIIGGTYGGTGVNNGASTITIGGNIAFSGAFTFAGTITGNTAVTFPTSGTLLNNTLASASFYVGNVSNVATGVAMSGDAALANTGAVTVSSIGGKAISLANSFTTSGNFAVIQTYTGATNVTFPTTGTLATTSQVPTLPLSPANGGSGVSNTGNFTWGAAVTFSGAFTTTFTITANTSVTLPTSGTLATTTQVILANNVTGTSASLASGNLYVANNVGLVTLTLPATAAVGDRILIRGSGAGGWRVAQNASGIIHIGSSASTTGVGGSVSSVNRYDCIDLTCIVANNEWVASGIQSAGLTIV